MESDMNPVQVSHLQSLDHSDTEKLRDSLIKQAMDGLRDIWWRCTRIVSGWDDYHGCGIDVGGNHHLVSMIYQGLECDSKVIGIEV
jgi:hypothetical protein